MRNLEELLELEQEVKSELNDNLTQILSLLNRKGQLEDFLRLICREDLINVGPKYETYKDVKILVIGESNVKQKDLIGIAKNLGIDKDRFEFYLNYEDALKFDFRSIQYNPNYSLIMVGPMPHSCSGKGDYSSVISMIEHENGYPKVLRMVADNKLKITNTSFKEKLLYAVENNIISVN